MGWPQWVINTNLSPETTAFGAEGSQDVKVKKEVLRKITSLPP
jgi:hypothetical protein